MADATLGMGIVFQIQDMFSVQAQRIQQSLAGLQNASQQVAQSMMGAFGSSTAAAMQNTAQVAADAQGRLRDASGRFLSMGGKEYLNAIRSGAVSLEKAVSDSIGKMQTAMGGLLAGAALASPFVVAINKAREFEQQLSNIKSLGVLPAQMQQVEALAMEMGAKTKFSALESAQGIEELLKAGVSLEQIMDKNGLAGALDLAVAGNLRLAEAATIASTGVNAFKKEGLTIRDTSNILAGAANASATDVDSLRMSLAQVGVVAASKELSFKDTNAALALFANNGFKGGDAGTSLKTMLDNLQPKTKEATHTFQNLGFMTMQGANAFYNAAGKLRPLGEIAGLLNTKLKHLTNQQREVALSAMFGSDAVRAGTIIFNEGAEGVAKMQREMMKVTAAQVAKEKLNNFNGALEMLSGSIDTILIRVGQLFLPALTRLTQLVGNVADAFLAFVNTPFGQYFVLAAGAVTSFIVVFGAVVPFLNTTVTVMRILGTVAMSTASAFLPYIPIAAVIFTAFKAFTSFKDVLEGTAKPATGLLGVLQKIGATMWTVGQVISTWDGKSFDLGGNEAQLKALGMLDTVRALSTYIVRFIELVKGFGSGIYAVFAGVGNAVAYVMGYVMAGVQAFLRFIGMQNAALKFSSSQVQSWVSVGKVLGYVVGTVLVGAAVAFTASLASMAVAVIAATWPILAIVAAVGAVVAAFYYWDDIVGFVSKGFNGAMQWMANTASWLWKQLKTGASVAVQAVGGFILNLPTYFWEGLKLAGSFVVDFFTRLLPYGAGALAGFGVGIIKQIPAFFSTAFSMAMQTAWWAITQGIPNLITSLQNFNIWAGGLIVEGISSAFTAALDLGYWAVTDGLALVGGAIGNFLSWVFVTVPNELASAFATAFAWVTDKTFAFFEEAGNFFYDGGKRLFDALWEGMKAIWNQMQEWLRDVASYATLGFVEGSQAATGPVASAQQSRPRDYSSMGKIIAENKAAGAQNAVVQSPQGQGGFGDIIVQLSLGDGQTLESIVSGQLAARSARQ
jgi:TP901 family phage tail tape measure protein